MTDALTQREELDHETMWGYLRRLLERVYGVFESETLIDDCLDVVVELMGADRGLVFLTSPDGATQVVNARSARKTLSVEEREEISRSIVREAYDAGRCVAWLPLESGAGSKSMVSLGIVAALAAPLQGTNAGKSCTRGVLYVDVRDCRKFVGSRHVEFFMAAALLLGATLEQSSRAELTRQHLREAEAHCVDSQRVPPLEELLAAPGLQSLRSEVLSAVPSRAPVIILGESGTGKTLLAQAIAEASGRRPLVRTVLGSSDDLNTITSELFGHERGAYSGASAKRIGLVEFAHGGTLLLDELLNFPVHAQRLLLDFTQFGTYRPLGYDKREPKVADVRIIASTNGDLLGAIRGGCFRNDLYQRLAGVVIELPPLRERRQDIVYLAERTLARIDSTRRWSLSLDLRRLLVSPGMEWRGNVRQLESVIQRARDRALSRAGGALELGVEHVEARELDGLPAPASPVAQGACLLDSVADDWRALQFEREHFEAREQGLIQRALVENAGVVAHAARALGIARTTLASRIDALGLPSYRPRTDGLG